MKKSIIVLVILMLISSLPGFGQFEKINRKNGIQIGLGEIKRVLYDDTNNRAIFVHAGRAVSFVRIEDGGVLKVIPFKEHILDAVFKPDRSEIVVLSAKNITLIDPGDYRITAKFDRKLPRNLGEIELFCSNRRLFVISEKEKAIFIFRLSDGSLQGKIHLDMVKYRPSSARFWGNWIVDPYEYQLLLIKRDGIYNVDLVKDNPVPVKLNPQPRLFQNRDKIEPLAYFSSHGILIYREGETCKRLNLKDGSERILFNFHVCKHLKSKNEEEWAKNISAGRGKNNLLVNQQVFCPLKNYESQPACLFHLYDANEDKTTTPRLGEYGYTYAHAGITSPDGKWILFGDSTVSLIYSIKEQSGLKLDNIDIMPINWMLSFSRDNNYFINISTNWICNKNSLVKYDLKNRKALYKVEIEDNNHIDYLKFSGDSKKIFSNIFREAFEIINLQDNTKKRFRLDDFIQLSNDPPGSFIVSDDFSRLFSSDGDDAIVVDINRDRLKTYFIREPNIASSMSPDGNVIAVAQVRNKSIVINTYSLHDKNFTKTGEFQTGIDIMLKEDIKSLLSCYQHLFMMDPNVFILYVSDSDKQIPGLYHINMANKKIDKLEYKKGWSIPRFPPSCFAFSRVKNLFALGYSDGKVLVWNLKTGKVQYDNSILKNLRNINNVSGIALSRDSGKLAISGSIQNWKDNSSRLDAKCYVDIYDTEKSRFLRRIEICPFTSSMAFSPDGKTLAVGKTGGFLMLYNLEN